MQWHVNQAPDPAYSNPLPFSSVTFKFPGLKMIALEVTQIAYCQ